MQNPLVTTYVDAAIAQLRRLGLMRWPGKVPDQMNDSSIAPSNDWVGWRAITSTVTDTDLDALEHQTALAFPSLYRDFLKYRHFIGLTEKGVRFARNLPGDWRETLRTIYFRS